MRILVDLQFKSLVCCLLVLTLFASCRSNRFSGNDEFKANRDGCIIDVRYSPPTGRSYITLGICHSNRFGTIGKDFTLVIQSLKRCACQYGGDGMLITSSLEEALRKQVNINYHGTVDIQADVIKYTD